MSDLADNVTPNPANASPVAPGTIDRAGTPFDSARHIAKKHPISGRWMPRGGRKPKPALQSSPSTSPTPETTAPATPTPSAPSPAVSSGQAQEIHASALLDLPPAGKPADFIPEIGPGETPPAPKPDEQRRSTDLPPPPAPAPAPVSSEDMQAGADQGAEVACETLYFATGITTGHMDEATPAPAEHAAIKRTLSAYFKKRGWVSVGGVAVTLTLLLYFLKTFRKQGSAAALKKFMAGLKNKSAKNVSPMPAEQPAAAPVATAKSQPTDMTKWELMPSEE